MTKNWGGGGVERILLKLRTLRENILAVFKYLKVHNLEQEKGMHSVSPRTRCYRKDIVHQWEEDLAHQHLFNHETDIL